MVVQITPTAVSLRKYNERLDTKIIFLSSVPKTKKPVAGQFLNRQEGDFLIEWK